MNRLLFHIVIFVALSFAAIALVPSQTTFAQTPAELACQGSGGTFTPNEPDPDTGEVSGGKCAGPTGSAPLLGPGGLIERVINVMLFIVGVLSVIMIIIGGIRYVISAGDSNNTQAAKNTILYAVIGLVVAVLAYALVNFLVNALV